MAVMWNPVDLVKPSLFQRALVIVECPDGNRKHTLAEYIPEKTVRHLTDSAADCDFVPEGWYECSIILNQSVKINLKILYWLVLPAMPI